MDPMINCLATTVRNRTTELSPSSRTKNSVRPRLASFPATQDATISWGRHQEGSWSHALGCAGIMSLCPLGVIFYWIALNSYEGSLLGAFQAMFEMGPISFVTSHIPKADYRVHLAYGGYMLFQAGLHRFLPGKLSVGQLTPAGNLLKYRTNGLLAWVLTHLSFAGLVMLGSVDSAIIAKNWEPLLVTANMYGFGLPLFAFLKAQIFPTHEGDRKFSGSILYDLYMGIEFNPRFGKYFDFKLFTIGRLGMMAWTLIDLSFVGYQYQIHGFITKSIIITTLLHILYTVDFFINEDWYLRTIDICHDHYGFYLAWGIIVWLPSMYTSQTQYLAHNPVHLSNLHAAAILLAGGGGYVLFRSVNHQKDLFRKTKGNCKIWGSPAEVIRVRYHTKDGLEHQSLLLCSGWWGMARHVNYLGDLVLSFAMCATCGTKNLMPWTYGIFMTVLLVHRCWRDEERCSQKYGKSWDEYCRKVQWVIIPGFY